MKIAKFFVLFAMLTLAAQACIQVMTCCKLPDGEIKAFGSPCACRAAGGEVDSYDYPCNASSKYSVEDPLNSSSVM